MYIACAYKLTPARIVLRREFDHKPTRQEIVNWLVENGHNPLDYTWKIFRKASNV